MANQKSTLQSIPFDAAINMNKNKTDIKAFSGYNERNCPVFGGCLSPLYFNKTQTSGQTIIDGSGNTYSYSSGELYKNGTGVMSISTSSLSSEKVEDISTVSSVTVNPKDVECFKYNGTTQLAYIVKTSIGYTLHYQYNGADYSNSLGMAFSFVYGYHILIHNNNAYFFIASQSSANASSNITVSVYNIDSVGRTGTTVNVTHNAGDTQSTWYSLAAGPLFQTTPTLNTSWKATFSCTPFGNWGAYAFSVIMTSGNQIAVTNYVYYFTPTSLYYLYMGEAISSGTSVNPIYRYPNFICGPNQVGYIGPTYSIVPLTNVKLAMLGGISDITVQTSTLSRTYTDTVSSVTKTWAAGTVAVATLSVGDSSTFMGNYGTYSQYENANGYDFMFDRYRVYTPLYTSSNGGPELYMYDSKMGWVRCGDSLADGCYQNYGGACVHLVSYEYDSTNWFVLYNNRLISGVSSSNHILVTEWNSVDTDDKVFYGTSEHEMIYRNTSDGYWYKVSDNSTVMNMQYVNDRYIIFSTTSEANCYDTLLGKACYYATDWNNRLFLNSTATTSISKYGCLVSAMNANLETSSSTVCGAQFPTSILMAPASSGNYCSDYIPNYISIQVYLSGGVTSESAVSASYACTVTFNTSALYTGYESTLSGTTYSNLTSNVLYNPSIFASYVNTYTNQNMVLINDKAYILQYYNNVCYLLYYLLSGLDNVTDSFVIQSVTYCISNKKIYKTVYVDGTLSLTTAIVDITGMTFIGASPYMALFFSSINRTLYSFTGNATLTKVQEANVINSITATGFNTATYKFYIATDQGIYILSGDDTQSAGYKVNLTGVTGISFSNGMPVITLEGGYVVKVSYVPKDGYTDNPIVIDTCYYGAGNNMVSIFDTWYIRLYDNGTPSAGSVKVSVSTMTNEGSTTETKSIQIRKGDWDAETNTYYMRYQPRFQRGIGASLHIESDFPISALSVGYVNDTTAQLSTVNI